MLNTIDRRANLSQRELVKEYVEPRKPVILTDAIASWPAFKKFTPEYFKEHYGNLTKQINGETYPLSQYVDLMLTSTPQNPAPYPCSLDVRDYFPELLNDMKPEVVYGKSDRIHHKMLPKTMFNGTVMYEIFLGGNGSSFPFLHIDALSLNTQITQLYGAKEFYMFPPGQTAFLYPDPDNPKNSQVNFWEPDHEKFPLYKNATPLIATVNPGETLLFPTGWWHTTRIYEPCITLGRIQLNNNNWEAFIKDNYRLWDIMHPAYAGLKSPVYIYNKLLGKIMSLQERFN